MEHSHEERIALNEAFFRQLNEKIAEAAELLHADTDGTVMYSLMCECSVFTCPEMVRMTMDQYSRVRQSPSRFVVAPEHMVEGVEKVVCEEDGYWVIEKTGLASDIVEVIHEAAATVVEGEE